MEVLSVSDFDKICRTCLIRNENYLFSIFTLNIIEQLTECTGVKVTFNDGLPTLICENCIQNVYQAINFKRNCLNSQEILQNVLKNKKCTNEDSVAEIKEEETDDKDFIDYVSVEINNENVTKETVKNETKGTVDDNFSNSSNKEQKLSSDECDDRLSSSPTDDEDELKTDEQIKKNKKDDLFYCRPCERFYPSLDLLKRHQKAIHEGKQSKTACDICGKSYVHLRRHISVKHTDETSHKCRICNQIFACPYYLLSHVREKHEGIKPEKPALCTLCGKSFKTVGELNKHKAIHSDERKHKCEVCGKAYKTRQNLTGHKKIHSEDRRYSCTYCNKKFYTNALLRIHVRVHTGDRPFVCAICNKNFSQKNHLNKHMRCIHKKF